MLSFLVALVILGGLPAQGVISYSAGTTQEKVEEEEEPGLPPIMKRIAECESGNRHFDSDGSLIRGRENSQDVGRFQINEYYHLEESRRLGYDIYTKEGNTAYALYLYEKNGTRDWGWSEHCWSGDNPT